MIDWVRHGVLLNGDGFHMEHMVDWRFVPFFSYWTLLVWVVQLFLAVLVYRDVEKNDGNGLLWFILVLLPWVGFLFLIVYLILYGEKMEREDVIEDALKVIDERYAKGEISREEYLQMKKDVKGKG